MVSNHIGFLEIICFMGTLELPPAFVAAHFIANFPIGRSYVSALQGIYANRAKDKAELDKAVQQITDRQKLIETSEHEYAPLCIFAEGSQTNGLNISRFRRGAFVGNYAMNPVMIKFDCKTVLQDYASLRGVESSFLAVSDLSINKLRVHRYPTFVPNEYLYTEYAKTIPGYEKMERWEIYAHAIEDLIRREGGFGEFEQQLREKLNLAHFLWSWKDVLEVNGKTYYWPPKRNGGKAVEGAADPSQK